MSKKKKKRKSRKNLLRILVAILIFFVMLMFVLLIFRFDLFGKIVEGTKAQMKIDIRGECYVIMDNLFYNINNEDDCRKECNNECWVREKEYFNSTFIHTPDACNICECYCR